MFVDELQGKHTLSGIMTDPNANGYILIIDATPYEIYEDDEDEYRSECVIRKLNSVPGRVYMIQNEEVEIEIGEIRDICNFEGGTYNGSYEDRFYIELFRIHNLVDKDIVFEGKTFEWGDWYPCCTFEYHPENLQINKEKK